MSRSLFVLLFGMGCTAHEGSLHSADLGNLGDSGDLTLPSCPKPSNEPVLHEGTITADETWASGIHEVLSDLAISEATLTLDPCAVVRLAPGRSITVRSGRLRAEGEAGRPVLFEPADPTASWGILRGYGPTAFVELHHTTLIGAGQFGGQYRNAAIAMTGAGYAEPLASVLEADNVTIEGPVGAGVYLDANAAFTDDSTALTVTGAADYPLVVQMMATGTIPDGNYAGNAADAAFVTGAFHVVADLTLRNRLPIVIQSGSVVVAAPGNETFPVTLTLEAGVELQFLPLSAGPGALVVFGGNGSPTNKVGRLIARGTDQLPVRFTSAKDTPAPGDWAGLWLDTAPGSQLDHVVIEYAGGSNGISSANCRPEDTGDEAALVVGNFSDTYVPPPDLLTHSVIRESEGFGINAVWVAAEFGPDLTDGNDITTDSVCNQTYNGVTSGICPTRGCF